MQTTFTAWKRVRCQRMGFLNVLKHIGIITASVLVIIGVPLCRAGFLGKWISNTPDIVSSASVVLDQPSGDFVILINRDWHTDEEALEDWITFFSGSAEEDELLIIFEDIGCSVASADAAGVELANSFSSQLPENQMKVLQEDTTLLMSRADEGLFDVIILSKEYADAYHAETAYQDNIEVVELKSK